MSHSTEVKIEIGLFFAAVTLELYYGSRLPAEMLGVKVGVPVVFTDDKGLEVVEQLRTRQAGYGALLHAALEEAREARETEEDRRADYRRDKALYPQIAEFVPERWMTVTVQHFD